jgi:hypothetical protein
MDVLDDFESIFYETISLPRRVKRPARPSAKGAMLALT